MMWEQVVDTVLNLNIFVFIGVLIWLYFKKTPDEHVTVKSLEERNGRPTDR